MLSIKQGIVDLLGEAVNTFRQLVTIDNLLGNAGIVLYWRADTLKFIGYAGQGNPDFGPAAIYLRERGLGVSRVAWWLLPRKVLAEKVYEFIVRNNRVAPEETSPEKIMRFNGWSHEPSAEYITG